MLDQEFGKQLLCYLLASACQLCICVGNGLMTLAYFGAENEEGASQAGTYTEAEVMDADTAAGLVTPPPTAQSKMSPQGPTTRSKSARKVSGGQVLAKFHFVTKSLPAHLCVLQCCINSCVSCSGQLHQDSMASQQVCLICKSMVPGAHAVACMFNALQHLQDFTVCRWLMAGTASSYSSKHRTNAQANS